MPMIRKEQARAYSRDAVVLDLGDLKRQGDAIIEQAKRKADEIVESAKRQRERLLEGASELGKADGFAQGKADGLVEGRAEGKAEAIARCSPELAALTDRWTEALERFESDRLLLLNQAGDSVLEFAVEFAQRITKRSIELDPEAACAQLASALGMLLRPTRVVIVVHPDDRGVIDEAMPALLARFDEIDHAELLTDESLAPGSCVVRAGDEEVNADVRLQIERLVDAVLPRNAAPGDLSGKPLEDAA